MHGDLVWYFGYGSNMSSTIFRERRGMQPHAAHPARLDGYRLCFDLPIGPGERGVANLELAPGVCTWGVAYLLTPDDLARLDRSEGVDRGYYHHATVEVVTRDDLRLAATTYRSRFGRAGRKPSPRYMGLLLDGAREHGLPRDYVSLLERFELAYDERAGTER